MIKSFAALGSSGMLELSLNAEIKMAEGISQSLLTTAAGLVVALPAYISHQYLSNRADMILREMERHSMSLVKFLASTEAKMIDDFSYDEGDEDV
jgi:biopolymer transport protein ExbB